MNDRGSIPGKNRVLSSPPLCPTDFGPIEPSFQRVSGSFSLAVRRSERVLILLLVLVHTILMQPVIVILGFPFPAHFPCLVSVTKEISILSYRDD